MSDTLTKGKKLNPISRRRGQETIILLMLNQEQLTLSGISQQKKGISGESMGEIKIYYWISALILQKSLKGK